MSKNSDEELYRRTLAQYDDPSYTQAYADSIEDRLDEWIFDEFLLYLPKNASVLDVGCAAGRDTAYLDSRGYHATGIDISQKLLDIAKKKHPGIKFIQGDFTQLPFSDGTFDAVWCKAALVHLPSQELVQKALREFARVMKKGGTIMLLAKAGEGKQPGTAVKVDALSGRERYFRYLEVTNTKTLMEQIGFSVVKSKVYNEQNGQQYDIMRDENWLFLIAKKNGKNWGEL